MLDWSEVRRQLEAYPSKVHDLRAPCPVGRIAEVESVLGVLPRDVGMMLQSFNGAELFVSGLPFITMFGLSMSDEMDSSDWFVDRFTPKWRVDMIGPCDWVIGVTYYGGVMVVGENRRVREWDSDLPKWTEGDRSIDDWWAWVIAEGTLWMSDERL